MTAEELNMDKRKARQILTINYEYENSVCQVVPKDPPVFSPKTNTNARTLSVPTKSCPA
jgi:hypothetical protein